MTGRNWLAVLAAVAIAAGLGYGVFAVYRGKQAAYCSACQRPIHAHSRTVALVNGRSRVFCCPACALSEHEQDGKPVRVTELTDFATGAKLMPSEAFVVKGSDVNMCARLHGPMDADKRPTDVPFDRCSPSLLAFSRRSDAVQFAREHGGQVESFREMVAAFAH